MEVQAKLMQSISAIFQQMKPDNQEQLRPMQFRAILEIIPLLNNPAYEIYRPWSSSSSNLAAFAMDYVNWVLQDRARYKQLQAREAIRETGFIETVLTCLNSEVKGLFQAALTCIVNITEVRDFALIKDFIAKGGFLTLSEHLGNPKDKIRSAIARVYSNCYRNRPVVMKTLAPYMKNMINSLLSYIDPYLLVNHLRALQEYVVNSNGEVLTGHVTTLNGYNATTVLNELQNLAEWEKDVEVEIENLKLLLSKTSRLFDLNLNIIKTCS